MMCFRDRSFCSASVTRCVNESCDRFFGPKQQAEADRWWVECEGDAPIAFMDFEPGCLIVVRPPAVTVYPDNLPPRYNGGQRCDMLVGPCACGAWHKPEESDEA